MALLHGIERFVAHDESIPERQIEVPPEDRQQTIVIAGQRKLNGATVEYTYEQPIDYIIDDVPLLIVNGYMGTEPAYDRWRQNTAQRGKPAITLRPVRKLSPAVALHRKYLTHPGALPSRAVYGVIQDMKERYEFEQFDVAGHSMGGWVSTMVAEEHPEDIRSITYVAAAGLEDHSFIKMMQRLPKFYKEEFKQHVKTLYAENHKKLAFESLHYILRRPLRTLAEGIGVSECDIRPVLPLLGAYGIKLAALNFDSDKLVLNTYVKQDIGHLFDYCETHPDSSLGHLLPQLEPLLVSDSVLAINKKINNLEHTKRPMSSMKNVGAIATAEVVQAKSKSALLRRLPHHTFSD